MEIIELNKFIDAIGRYSLLVYKGSMKNLNLFVKTVKGYNLTIFKF